MGYEKIKRPILAPGLDASSGSAPDPADVVGDISGNLVFPTEMITLATADQEISPQGVSFLTLASSGAGMDAVLSAPTDVGQVKQIYLINNTTSVDCRIHTNATANVFWGTTYNTVSVSAASTGSPGGTPGGTLMLGLVAHSTTTWALFPGTTFNWDLSASTGSTSIA